MLDANPIAMSLDDMIDQDYKQRPYRKAANPNELKQQIEKYKQRTERFTNEDEAESRQRKIQRMEKKLEWTEHKAPPLPIMQGSTILPDSLYLYGVDFMSTDDVKKYFKRYANQEAA